MSEKPKFINKDKHNKTEKKPGVPKKTLIGEVSDAFTSEGKEYVNVIFGDGPTTYAAILPLDTVREAGGDYTGALLICELKGNGKNRRITSFKVDEETRKADQEATSKAIYQFLNFAEENPRYRF